MRCPLVCAWAVETEIQVRLISPPLAVGSNFCGWLISTTTTVKSWAIRVVIRSTTTTSTTQTVRDAAFPSGYTIHRSLFKFRCRVNAKQGKKNPRPAPFPRPDFSKISLKIIVPIPKSDTLSDTKIMADSCVRLYRKRLFMSRQCPFSSGDLSGRRGIGHNWHRT